MSQDICSGSGIHENSISLKLVQPNTLNEIDNPQLMISSIAWLLADSDSLTFV